MKPYRYRVAALSTGTVQLQNVNQPAQKSHRANCSSYHQNTENNETNDDIGILVKVVGVELIGLLHAGCCPRGVTDEKRYGNYGSYVGLGFGASCVGPSGPVDMVITVRRWCGGVHFEWGVGSDQDFFHQGQSCAKMQGVNDDVDAVDDAEKEEGVGVAF